MVSNVQQVADSSVWLAVFLLALDIVVKTTSRNASVNALLLIPFVFVMCYAVTRFILLAARLADVSFAETCVHIAVYCVFGFVLQRIASDVAMLLLSARLVD